MLILGVIGGGLYGGYRWTQTQFYVGAQNENVALFRGISQDLAWISLSEVEKNHPEIELKYLPPYQRKQVEATIAEGSITDARKKVDELAAQASACKKDAQRRAAEAEAETSATPPPRGPSRTPRLPLPAPASRRKRRSWSRSAVSSKP